MDILLKSSQLEEDEFIMSFSNNKNLSNKKNQSQQMRSYSKHKKFIQDDQEIEQILLNDKNKQKSKQTHNRLSNKNQKIHTTINNNQLQTNNKFSPQIITLLQNCKLSINSLQEEVTLKNEQITKLTSQNQKLTSKLIQTQKQIQRNHQILNIYIKQSQTQPKLKQFVTTKPEIQTNLTIQIQNQKLNAQIQKQKQIIQQTIKENQHFKNQNYHLKQQIRKLYTQINHLQQKVYKMGKGVGKALSTIKKNNPYSMLKNNPQINIIPFTQNKENTRDQINGKIIFKSQLFSHKQISFQTPLKKSTNKNILISNQKFHSTTEDRSQVKETFSPQKCEKKMEQISIHAKKFDQIDKIQSLLSKMQQLSQIQNSQEQCQD